MTRNEFIENINDFYALKEVCNDYGYDIELYDSSEYDDEVENDVSGRECGWETLRDYLSDLPTDYDYYRRNGWLDYDGVGDNEFQDYKNEVEEWMADNEYFDDEEEELEDDVEDEAPADEEDEEDEAPADEDFGVNELIGMCGVAFFSIRKQEEKDACEQEREFAKLTSLGASQNRTI